MGEEKPIGQGGFGRVHRALYSGGLVAVKITNNDFVDFEAWRDEVDTVLALHHPHIIQLYGVVDVKGYDRMIVSELCANGSLDKLYQNRPHEITHVRILRWMKQTCGAMKIIHEQARVLHRDLKCGNLLVTVDYSIKVTDLGEASKMTESSVVMAHKGTLRWRAPELMSADGADVLASGALSGQSAAPSSPRTAAESSQTHKSKSSRGKSGKRKGKNRRHHHNWQRVYLGGGRFSTRCCRCTD